MEVLKGNHTLQAALQLGWTEVDVYLIDVTEEQALRILVADNRSSDLATYDLDLLVEVLAEFDNLIGSGYTLPDVDELNEELSAGVPVPDDEVPMPPAEPLTRPGELIVLGEHRLFCGDACEAGSYERLLGDELVDLVVTDPPYGVS